MKYLLDTNIAILYLNDGQTIVTKMYKHFNVYISTITVGELHYGFSPVASLLRNDTHLIGTYNIRYVIPV